MQIVSPRGARPRATADNSIDQNIIIHSPPSPHRQSLQRQLQTGVVVIEVSRNPNALFQSLDADAQLHLLRSALSEAGFDPQLPSGASLLVPLDQYRAVKMVAERLDLKRRHFVVSHDLEPLLHSLIQGLPSKDNVRVKSRETISGLKLYTTVHDILAEVSHSFIEIAGSSSMRSRPRGPATSSTTDAHGQHGRNPRRV